MPRFLQVSLAWTRPNVVRRETTAATDAESHARKGRTREIPECKNPRPTLTRERMVEPGDPSVLISLFAMASLRLIGGLTLAQIRAMLFTSPPTPPTSNGGEPSDTL